MALETARRIGRYAPLSTSYYEDDAVAEAGEAAELLYVRTLAFCAGRDTDGAITRIQVQRFAGVGMPDALDRAEKLVEVGLWERDGNGYRVRSWLKYNRSAEEIDRYRTRDRTRKGKPAADLTTAETPQDDVPSGIRAESESAPSGIQSESERNPRTTSRHVSAVHVSTEHLSPCADPTPDSLLAEAGATPAEREKFIPLLTKKHNIQGMGWWINAAKNGTLAARLQEVRTEQPKQPPRTNEPDDLEAFRAFRSTLLTADHFCAHGERGGHLQMPGTGWVACHIERARLAAKDAS